MSLTQTPGANLRTDVIETACITEEVGCAVGSHPLEAARLMRGWPS